MVVKERVLSVACQSNMHASEIHLYFCIEIKVNFQFTIANIQIVNIFNYGQLGHGREVKW